MTLQKRRILEMCQLKGLLKCHLWVQPITLRAGNDQFGLQKCAVGTGGHFGYTAEKLVLPCIIITRSETLQTED